jgi:hypothetical protein
MQFTERQQARRDYIPSYINSALLLCAFRARYTWMSIGFYVGKLIFQASGVDGRGVTVKELKPHG